MEFNKENDDYKSENNHSSNHKITSLNIEVPLSNHSNDVEKNKKTNKSLYIKIVIAIIYFILIIGIEQAYRKALYDKSVKAQVDIRKDYTKESIFYQFWKFMSLFGIAGVTFPIFSIIFLFFPLSSSFLTLQILIYSIYITNLFKIIYRNGRPYWESDILDLVCNSGYGNPSGHSVTSTAYYLTLPHIITNLELFRKDIKGKVLSIIIFCLFIILGALVIISRVILAAHSINQVIYGFTLGLGIYFVEIYILSYHTYKPHEFINHITNFLTVLIYMIFHLSILILLIIIYFVLGDEQTIKYNIEKDIFNEKRCKIKNEYLMLKHEGFFQGLAITAILGAHLGIILLVYLLKKNNYNINGYITQFNNSSIKKWLIRLPILLISGIFIILYFCVPGDSPLSIIFIFKSSLSFFLTTLGIYFVGIFICIYYNFANECIVRNL